jgi:hypothetical protein
MIVRGATLRRFVTGGEYVFVEGICEP